MSKLDTIAELIQGQRGKPPIDKWHPDLSGDIDIVIRSDGRWFHEGGEIKRHELVKLFASILRREADGDYYLVTPVEKWRIQVEDLPLQIIDAEIEPDRIGVLTNVDDWCILGESRPLVVSTDSDSGEPRPQVELDHGLSARVARAVFYRLVDEAEVDAGQLWLQSQGQRFSLGRTE